MHQDKTLMLTFEADVLKQIPVPKINGMAKHIVENNPANNAWASGPAIEYTQYPNKKDIISVINVMTILIFIYSMGAELML